MSVDLDETFDPFEWIDLAATAINAADFDDTRRTSATIVAAYEAAHADETGTVEIDEDVLALFFDLLDRGGVEFRIRPEEP